MREGKIKVHDVNEWRMDELRAICKQYAQLRRGTEKQRARAQRIEDTARQTRGGGWETALLASCCDGKKYEQIDPETMPTSNRNAFFAARREFFSRLDDVME